MNDCTPPDFARDRQEALSIRYGNAVVILVPLSSGRIALFGNDRQLIDIYDEIPALPELRTLCANLALQLRARALHIERSGEQNDREFARHLRTVRKSENTAPATEIDVDALL
jgi:DNA-binding transcriptional regulator YbjK